MAPRPHPREPSPRCPRAPGGEDLACAIVEHLSTAALVFDGALRLRAINPAGEALLALSAKQAEGQTIDGLLPEAEVLHAALARVAHSAQPLVERETELGRPGTGPVTVDCVITPVLDGVPEPMLLVELVHLERHRQLSREEQLLAQNESARALVRALAHEIRNPLGGLRGAAQLLERELDDPGLKEYTRIIVGEADRLQNLLDRLLGPRTLPRMRRVNVHEVTERVCALIEAGAAAGVRVERDYDPSLPPVHADPELLIQAILNVARNAVQSVGGTGRVMLRTRVHRSPGIGSRRHGLVVRIDVVDDGPGIPTALREQIFFPMVSGRPGGTGLGLSIAQSLVHQHGGLIECSSEPGSTVFSVLLPVERDPSRLPSR